MPGHRSTSMLLAAVLVAPLLFLWSPSLVQWTTRPTTFWVEVGRPEAAASSSTAAPPAGGGRAAGAGPAAQPEPPSQQLQQRVLQTCVRDGGFYQGEWQHRPNVVRSHAHYARGLAGKHKFFEAELTFRKAHPLDAAANQTTPAYLPHVQYDWEPHAQECRLSPFNRTRACLALGEAAGASHRVLFVGDSMSFAHALSLLFMLGPDGNVGRWVPKQTEWVEEPVCGDVLGGADRAVLVHFIRNDALYVAPEVLADGWDMRPDLRAVVCAGVDFESSRPWTPYFERHLPGLVMLNLGTHIHGMEYYEALLDDTLGYLQGHRAAWRRQEQHVGNSSGSSSSKPTYPRLLFRNTAPGHPDCWRYQAPASEAEARALARYEGKYRDRFTWHLIPAFNDYLERRLGEVIKEQGDMDGVLLLRVEGITRRRPDGHLAGELKDCLHYHMPGPMDAWTLALLETLYALHGV